MRQLRIMYYSLNHKNPTKAQRHEMFIDIPDNFGKIDEMDIVSKKVGYSVLVKIV